jgi:hypothetical protein
MALDDLCGLHPEEGRRLGETQALREEGEEAGVAQGDPRAALVELSQRDQEVGHGVLLVPEELGESVGGVRSVEIPSSVNH